MGIPITDFMNYFEIKENQFNRNFIHYLSSDYGAINYYVFIKLCIFCSFISALKVMLSKGIFHM